MRALLPVLMGACLLAAPTPAHARRLPSNGGEVRIFSDDGDQASLEEALVTIPMVEPAGSDLSPTEGAAWPSLDGTNRRSRLIASAQASDGGALWTLTPTAVGSKLSEATARCLGADAKSWPARALAASGIVARVTDDAGSTSLAFSAPVGDLLTLLEGCYVPAGPFVADGAGWRASANAVGGRPRLDAVRWVPTPSEADLLLTSDDETGQLLVAEWPDVWLLVPDAASLDGGAWALADEPARAAFQRELAPELILAVRRSGRGAGASSILPSGVAPSGPPITLTPSEPRTLTITPLPDSAPTVRLAHDPGDALAADLADRLALLLRARGWAVAATEAKGATTRILRWRPPVADAALALLLLGAELDLPVPATLLPALWSADRATRTSAALSLEQQWMNEGLVTPLLTAARTVFVNPALRGVSLRGDGVPILGAAWWNRP